MPLAGDEVSATVKINAENTGKKRGKTGKQSAKEIKIRQGLHIGKYAIPAPFLGKRICRGGGGSMEKRKEKRRKL
jgi:hypothetical protein